MNSFAEKESGLGHSDNSILELSVSGETALNFSEKYNSRKAQNFFQKRFKAKVQTVHAMRRSLPVMI